VDAENDIVVGARDDSHEALLGKTTLRRQKPDASLAKKSTPRASSMGWPIPRSGVALTTAALVSLA
jgi:hypothetical protein